jgi:ribosomal protein S12 methylthiotransferase accessory factor
MPLCAAFYMRKFCQQREISTEGLKVVQNNENICADDHYKKKITLEVTLPDNFPKKYNKAILAAANTCTVKKVIQALPEFEISII